MSSQLYVNASLVISDWLLGIERVYQVRFHPIGNRVKVRVQALKKTQADSPIPSNE